MMIYVMSISGSGVVIESKRAFLSLFCSEFKISFPHTFFTRTEFVLYIFLGRVLTNRPMGLISRSFSHSMEREIS